MKYLVNRETKEHVIFDYNIMEACPPWDVVEADDEGWIKWDGKFDCPVSLDSAVEIRAEKYGFDRGLADCWNWPAVKSYRPILPAESNQHLGVAPSLREQLSDSEQCKINTGTFAESVLAIEMPKESTEEKQRRKEEGVFMRLKYAVSASEQIPSLIAEINAMLPEGYEVRERAKVGKPQASGNVQWSRAWARKVRNWIAITEQVTSSCQSKSHRDELRKLREQISDYLAHGISKTDGCLTDSLPAEDMSDWRNWRKGDILEWVSESKNWYTKGGLYEVLSNPAEVPEFYIKDNDGDSHRWQFEDYEGVMQLFKFHSRPVTK